MKIPFLLLAIGLWSHAVDAQTYCDHERNELRKFGLAARYQQLPEGQRAGFFAQLSPADQMFVMGATAGHQMGSGINNAAGGGYSSSLVNVYNQKIQEYRSRCGSMPG